MEITNDQHCTLVIGGVQIKYAETKAIHPRWEARCEELAAAGALRIAGRGKPLSAKDQAVLLLAKLTPAERAELGLANAPVTMEVTINAPAPEGSTTMTPDEFAACHVATAKAFVRGCNDLDLLHAYAANEGRPTVVEAISQRVKVLEDAAKEAAN